MLIRQGGMLASRAHGERSETEALRFNLNGLEQMRCNVVHA